MSAATKLSSKFQISIPKEVREQQGWKAGQEFVFLPKGRGVVLVPVPKHEDLRGIAEALIPKTIGIGTTVTDARRRYVSLDRIPHRQSAGTKVFGAYARSHRNHGPNHRPVRTGKMVGARGRGRCEGNSSRRHDAMPCRRSRHIHRSWGGGCRAIASIGDCRRHYLRDVARHDAELLTCDAHFKDLPGVLYFAKVAE